MRKESLRTGQAICYVRYCNDWLDLVSCAKNITMHASETGEYNGLTCSSLKKDRDSWAGTASLDEAIQLAHRGWPEGRYQIREVRKRLRIDKLVPHIQRVIPVVAEDGDIPDIGLYLSGNPEHMTTLHSVVDHSKGKVLRLVISMAVSSSVPADKITRRGVAILLALETLLMLGFTLSIVLVNSVNKGDSLHYELYIPVLHPGEPTNLDTLAFMLMHPSVLRRLVFAADECEPNDIRKAFGFHSEKIGGGYGHPCRPVALPEHDLFLNGDDGLVSSDDEIIPLAVEFLGKMGIDVDWLIQAEADTV